MFFRQIDWKTEGSLIYWYIEVSGPVDFYVIDSSDYNDIVDEIWDKEAVFSTVVETETEYEIVLPYDDTFYFAIFNRRYSLVEVDGWYARDETNPVGEMWGINTNFADEILIGSTRDISCVFNDWFDIVNIVLYENDVMARTFTGPADTMVEWTISEYEFTTLGIIEMAFKCEDRGRNVKTISKTIEVVNKLSLPPTTSRVEYLDWVGFFEDYWFVIIPIGAVLGIVAMFGLEKAGILH